MTVVKVPIYVVLQRITIWLLEWADYILTRVYRLVCGLGFDQSASDFIDHD